MSIDYDHTYTDLPGLREIADPAPIAHIDDIGANVARDHGPGTPITVHSLAPMTLTEATNVAADINTHGSWDEHATAVMLVPADLYAQLVELDRWLHSTYHETAADLRGRGIDEPTVGRGIGGGVVAEFARRHRAHQIPRCGENTGRTGPDGGEAA